MTDTIPVADEAAARKTSRNANKLVKRLRHEVGDGVGKRGSWDTRHGDLPLWG